MPALIVVAPLSHSVTTWRWSGGAVSGVDAMLHIVSDIIPRIPSITIS